VPVLKLRNGASLNYDQAGLGCPLVLVHGSPGEGRAWARVMKYLPPDMHVLTPDLPGYGASAPLSSGTVKRTEAMAAAIGELIEGCADACWLCGHSYGGNVALHAALRQRDRVEGLVLIEPVFMRALELAGERETLAETGAFFTAYLLRVESAEPDAIGLMIDFWLGSGAYEKLPPSTRKFLNGAAAKNAQDVRASFAETVSAAQLASFDRPVLIAHGAASNPVATMIATSLARLLPRARVQSIPGATHTMLESHPRDVAGLINRLCGGHAWTEGL
jgi:pimeloyl-ACP methyl ester carboxylesterase